jgi:uncharacterized protein YigA (DUF484 family)
MNAETLGQHVLTAPIPQGDTPALAADHVAAYLRAHPGFLAERPELFASLAPPVRVHGAVMADHMAAMIVSARRRTAEMEAHAEAVLAAGRATGFIAARVQAAVLALMRAADPVECVGEIWPGLLGVDAATLACEEIRPRWQTLPQGTVKTLLGNRTVVLRDQPANAQQLHAEAALLATRDMLVEVSGASPALLALVSRDPAALPATQAWAFLGHALGTRLGET